MLWFGKQFVPSANAWCPVLPEMHPFISLLGSYPLVVYSCRCINVSSKDSRDICLSRVATNSEIVDAPFDVSQTGRAGFGKCQSALESGIARSRSGTYAESRHKYGLQLSRCVHTAVATNVHRWIFEGTAGCWGTFGHSLTTGSGLPTGTLSTLQLQYSPRDQSNDLT